MKKPLRRLAFALFVLLLFSERSRGQAIGNDNPTGKAGEYNGSITTAGSYDPYTGNAKRFVDDLTVTGGVGSYPLKWTRILNTRGGGGPFGQGGGWRHSYQWALSLWPLAPQYSLTDQCPPPVDVAGTVHYPDGRTMNLNVEEDPVTHVPYYVQADGLEPTGDRLVRVGGGIYDAGDYDLILKDGGKVQFRHVPYIGFVATTIVDPYGQTTMLEHDAPNRLSGIQEPGGRYLKINYTSPAENHEVIESVKSYDTVNGALLATVSYEYEVAGVFNGSANVKFVNLIHANYHDEISSRATYVYSDPFPLAPGVIQTYVAGTVTTCDDVRYAGAMKKIQYQYATTADTGLPLVRGQIKAEINPTTGVAISRMTYPHWGGPNGVSPCQPTQACWVERTETRADGRTRKFTYNKGLSSSPELESYTDFADPNRGEVHHITTITYSGAGIPTAPNMPRVPSPSQHYFRTVRDALQHETTTEKEWNIGAVMAVIHPNLTRVEFTYEDPANPHYLATKKDERGKITRYTRYTNDADKHRIQRIDYPDGGWEEFPRYNAFAQVLTHKRPFDGQNDAYDHFQYDGRGRLWKQWVATPNSQWPPPDGPIYPYSRFEYYPTGPSTDRVYRSYDPLGHYTEFLYDQRGNVTRVTHQDETFSYNQSHYNPDGTLDWTADENHPNAGQNGHESERTRYLYDEYKRVASVTNPMQETVHTRYDPNHGTGPDLSLTHTTLSVYQTESEMHRITNFEYNANFQREKITEAPGDTRDQAITEFFYDAVGNLIRQKDPRDRFTTYGYDDRNRQTSVLIEELGETTIVEYDDVGNKIAEQRPDLSVRKWDYDEMNRLSHAYDWRSPSAQPSTVETTTYLYNIAGNLEKIIDTKGAIYQFGYDLTNRKIYEKYPEDPVTHVVPIAFYGYDAASNLTDVINPAQQWKHLHYDSRNRQDLSWWNMAAGPTVGTHYDPAGRVTEILASSGAGGSMPDTATAETVIGYHYDQANRKIWEDQTVGGYTRRVQTLLDEDGKRKSLELLRLPQNGGGLISSVEMLESGFYSLTFGYTKRDQLETISGDSQCNFTYTYNRIGAVTERRADYNGVSSFTRVPNDDYDALGRARSWEQSGPNGFHLLSHYQYDKANREVATWRDEEGGRGEHFVYDRRNQLSHVDYNALGVSGQNPNPTGADLVVDYAYTPDRLNRSSMTKTSQSGSPVVTAYSPNSLNQYKQVGGTTYSYDDNFNLTHAPSPTPSGSQSSPPALNATYDGASHLVLASNESSPQTVVSFVYDGLGRCVKRINRGVATIFIYDGWKPIAEFSEWDELQAWNVYGPGADEILLRQGVKIGYTRFHQDRHGNVTFLVDNAGIVQEKYTYDVFGRPTVTDLQTGATRDWSFWGHDFLFQGREWIHELGIYDYRNRFYSPEIGQFLQKDPTEFDGGDINLFRYCNDDPVDHSDPTGLAVDWFWQHLRWEQGNSKYGFNDLVNMHLGFNQPAGNISYALQNQHEGAKQMGFIGLSNAINAARNDAEAIQQRYAEEGTAIDRAKALPGAADRPGNKRENGDLRITNYGYKGDNMKGDPNTPQGIGIGKRILTQNTVALSRDYAKQFHRDNGIYVNGHYIGNYRDKISDKSVRTIDVYDPHGKGEWRVFMPAGSYKITEGPALMNY